MADIVEIVLRYDDGTERSLRSAEAATLLNLRGDEVPLERRSIVEHDLRRYGTLEVDLTAWRAIVEGSVLALTRIEFLLLATLSFRPSEAVSRADLLRLIWGDGSGSLETRTVDAHMHRLRSKLGTYGRLITAVHGVGYRFDPPVEDEPLSAQARELASATS